MRALTVVLASVVLSVTAGCAASPAAPAAVPEPIAYNAADYNPPSDFDMSFAPQGVAQGPAIKRSQPAEGSYKARMVSLEKPEDQSGR